MIRRLTISALLIAAFAFAAHGTIPQAINYQGILTDAGGTAVPDGTYQLTFRLYDAPTGGSPLWEETQGSVTVTKGIFNVSLGSVTPFNLPFDEQYFLGISVEGEAELTPRIYMESAAYSLASRSLHGVSNVIPADGNVGIGTLHPNYPITVESDAPVGIRYQGNASAWAGIYVEALQPAGKPQFGYVRDGFLKANMYVDTIDRWILHMDGAARLTVKPDGNTGIGATNPVEKLDVAGGIKLGTTSNTYAGTIRYSAGDFEGYDGSTWKSLTGGGGSGLPDGVDGQTLRHNGGDWIATSNLYNNGTAIGVGTVSPVWDLHVLNDANHAVGIGIQNPNAGNTASEYISFRGSSGDISGLAAFGSGHMAYPNEMHLFNNRPGGLLELSAGSSRITIPENGGIGVNKTNPAATLDVAGGNGDLDGTNGDVRIGNNNYRLKIGVATDGLGAGTAGIRAQGGTDRLVLGAGSAEVVSIEGTGEVDIGSDVQDGELNLYRSGISGQVMELTTSSYGGELQAYDDTGNLYCALEPDYDGTGGYLQIRRSGGSIGFRVDGNFTGTENTHVTIFGSTQNAVFDMSQSGNSSVRLPADAVGSVEIEDEPGVASQTYSDVSIHLTGGLDILLSRSIVVPAAGYVLVIGTLNGYTSHTSGAPSYVYFGVSDDSGALPDNQTVTLQVSSGAGSGIYHYPVTVHGLFSVSAGTHDFYILGDEGGGDIRVSDMQLSLLYIPTAYGTVSPTIASGRPAGHEDDAAASPMTAAEVAAQRAESEAFNAARIQRELDEMRSRLETLERQGERQ